MTLAESPPEVFVKCKPDLFTRGMIAAEVHFKNFGYHTMPGVKSAFGKAFNERMGQLLTSIQHTHFEG